MAKVKVKVAEGGSNKADLGMDWKESPNSLKEQIGLMPKKMAKQSPRKRG